MIRRPPRSTLFPYTTLFRSDVVMADPMDHEAIQDLSFVTGCQVSPTLGSRSQIRDAIERFYARHLEGAGRLMAKGVGQATTPLLTPRSQEASALDADAEDAPVVQLMNLIMQIGRASCRERV